MTAQEWKANCIFQNTAMAWLAVAVAECGYDVSLAVCAKLRSHVVAAEQNAEIVRAMDVLAKAVKAESGSCYPQE